MLVLKHKLSLATIVCQQMMLYNFNQGKMLTHFGTDWNAKKVLEALDNYPSKLMIKMLFEKLHSTDSNADMHSKSRIITIEIVIENRFVDNLFWRMNS